MKKFQAVGLLTLLTACDPVCPVGQAKCGGICTDLQSDAMACGKCGESCPAGGACIKGQCGCPEGTQACGGVCIDTSTSAEHCGGCGRACGLGTCQSGVCVCATSPATVRSCEGSPQCVDVSSDPRNCGGCGAACRTGAVCASSACSCPASIPDACPAACVDLRSDAKNCGTCGNACPLKGAVCATGACACPAAQPDACTGACVDLKSDTKNCGTCGKACNAGETCEAGACVCPSPATLCTLASGAVCTDLKTDPQNCNTCGNVCGAGQSCVAGLCTCESGKRRCAGLCVDTATDVNNCGGCGTSCGVGETCSAGKCYALVCDKEGCAGGTACCTSGDCPLAHRNGAGGTYYDCHALGSPTLAGSYTEAMATAAARAWSPTGKSVSGCSGCVAVSRDTQCGQWCWSGGVQGLAAITSGGAGCGFCPTSSSGAFYWE